MQDVLQIHEPSDSPITVRQIGAGPDYRPLLKEILNSGETHIIMDCATDIILEIFRQGGDVKMLEEYQVKNKGNRFLNNIRVNFHFQTTISTT